MQLWKGCCHSACEQRLCASGRGQQGGKPVRGFSRLSARAAATHLATVDKAETLLCINIRSEFLPDCISRTRPAFSEVLANVIKRLEELSAIPLAHETATPAKSGKDPKSFFQHLFDTKSFRSFLQQIKAPDQGSIDVQPELAQDRAAHVAISAENGLRRWLTRAERREALSGQSTEDEDSTDQKIEIATLMAQAIEALNNYISAMDYQDHQIAWCDDRVAIGLATQLVLVVSKALGGSCHGAGILSENEQRDLWNCIGESTIRQWYLGPWAWMQNIFLRHWNGKVTIRRQTVAGHALHAMQSFINISSRTIDGKTDPLCPELLHSRPHPTLADTSALADGFIRYCYESDQQEAIQEDGSFAEQSEKLMCVTEYAWLMPQKTSLVVFRGICYQRLREAMGKSLINVKLLQRCFVKLSTYGFWPPQVVSLQYGALRPACSAYLTIQVRREHLVSDAYDELWRRQYRELLRPLRVNIVNAGEMGNDQGGISQEFFRLAAIEITDPAYGMFKWDEAGRFDWFDPATLEPLFKFELFGLIVGLAVHNGYTLPLTFPLTLYCHLCGEVTKFPSDIHDDWSEVVRNLEHLLNYDGDDVEDVFGLDFTFYYQGIDKVEQMNMLDFVSPKAWGCYGLERPSDNHSLPVTSNNRRVYVETYVEMVALYSVHGPSTAFARGFHTIMSSEILRATNPQNLKILVEGMQQDIDSYALQQAATYGEEYEAENLYINMFWSVVHDLPQERKKKLLEFVTASDRVPVNGIESIPFKIERGADPNMLPTSHTCFGMLRLPEYANREELKRKLNIALDHTEGFGII